MIPAEHYECIAYADDVAEGNDEPVPEDYERRYCDYDGETWPCETVRTHQVIPTEAVEAAFITTAFVGLCESCGSRSRYGLPYIELEEWIEAHNAANHRPTP